MKSKKKKNSTPKTNQKIAPKYSTIEPSNIKNLIIKILAGFATLFGLLFGIWQYCEPRISIAATTSLNPQNALDTPFIISNVGNTSICDVECFIGVQSIDYITPTGPKIHLNGRPDFMTRFGDKVTSRMLAGESFTLVPSLSPSLSAPTKRWPGTKIEYAEIAVIIVLRPEYIPKKMTMRYRFATVQSSDGKLVWCPIPISN